VAWIEEAFGTGAAWQAGYLGWVAGATDNGIYPVYVFLQKDQFRFLFPFVAGSVTEWRILRFQCEI
jgi:hypothetical protein